MNEQLKKIPEALKQFWSGLSKTVRIVLIVGVVVVLALALALSLMLNRTEYVKIYDGLSASEASEILAILQGMDVDVKMEGGDSILVPDKREVEVRMYLATQNYPKSGLSYYLIQENSGMLTTDYERKQWETMQLQERLGASIETLTGVKQAIVTIAQSDESIFYLTDKTEPSASVTVHMKDGYKLGEEQVLGIRNLVASAVSGLSTDNVSMIDGNGNDLLGDSVTGTESKRSRLAAEVESQIKRKIDNVLEAPYGTGHFRVSVTANINTDNYIQEEMTYYPSQDDNNTGVIREETHATDDYTSTETDGGVPGTSTNADVTTYPTYSGNSETESSSTSDNIKYDVSYVKRLLERNGAYIEDLSVGVVIDKAIFEPGERDNLTELVAYAAGVPEDSVTVQGFLFYREAEEEPPIEEFNQNILYFGIAGGVLLLLIIVVIILLVRRRKKMLEQMALEEAAKLEREKMVNAAFGDAHDEEPQKLEIVEDSMRQEIKQFAMENPEIAAQMIKTWLRSEE